MDSTKMAAEVREWLEESGILKEMQSTLRAKMIERLMDKNKRGHRLKNKNASLPQRTAALNSLFLEHLLHSRLWYTAAVFAREATDDFGSDDRDANQTNKTLNPKSLTCLRIQKQEINYIILYMSN